MEIEIPEVERGEIGLRMFGHEATIDELKKLIKKGYKLHSLWHEGRSKGYFWVDKTEEFEIPVEIRVSSEDIFGKEKWLEAKKQLEEVI